jgi:caa(3)-type oxidase subunit IV
MNNLRVWTLLLGLTAIEVALAYVRAPMTMMLVALVVLSVAKSAYIVNWFMHMNHERRALKLAIFPVVIILILTLFAVLPDANAQCVMCGQTASAQNQAKADRLNQAIIAMMVPAMSIMTAFALYLCRRG